MVFFMQHEFTHHKGRVTAMNARDDHREFEARAFELMSAPVDPETFIFMAGVFDAAGRMVMPTAPARDLAPVEASTLALFAHSDQTFNRAMMTVATELQEMGVENPAAYLARLAMLPDLYNVAASIFSEFIQNDPAEPGMVVVRQALMKAAAVGQVFADADGIGFDLGDVLSQARHFAGKPQVQAVTQ